MYFLPEKTTYGLQLVPLDDNFFKTDNSPRKCFRCEKIADIVLYLSYGIADRKIYKLIHVCKEHLTNILKENKNGISIDLSNTDVNDPECS